MGPDQLSRGPPWRPPGRQTHVSGPALGPLEIPQGPIKKKLMFFLKIAKTTINIRSGALRGKRQAVQNRVFRPLDAPWRPPEAERSFSRPPRRAPERALELPGPPRALPRAHQSLQGVKFTKLVCSKPWKCVYFALRNLKKTLPDGFYDAPSASQGPSGTVSLILKGAPVDMEAKDGATALFAAAQKGATEPLRLLLAGGAAVDLANNAGCTPLRHPSKDRFRFARPRCRRRRWNALAPAPSQMRRLAAISEVRCAACGEMSGEWGERLCLQGPSTVGARN